MLWRKAREEECYKQLPVPETECQSLLRVDFLKENSNSCPVALLTDGYYYSWYLSFFFFFLFCRKFKANARRGRRTWYHASGSSTERMIPEDSTVCIVNSCQERWRKLGEKKLIMQPDEHTHSFFSITCCFQMQICLCNTLSIIFKMLDFLNE